jgi:hypothetical protein
VGRQHQVQRHWYLEKVEIVGRRIYPNDSDEVLKVSLPFFSGQEKKFTHAFSSFYKTYLIPKFRLNAPTLRIKTVTDSGDLWALLFYTYGYDRRILATIWIVVAFFLVKGLQQQHLQPFARKESKDITF